MVFQDIVVLDLADSLDSQELVLADFQVFLEIKVYQELADILEVVFLDSQATLVAEFLDSQATADLMVLQLLAVFQDIAALQVTQEAV